MTQEDAAYLGGGHWIEFCTVGVDQPKEDADIPLRDVAPIVVEVLRRDLMSLSETWLILEAAEESLYRRAKAMPDTPAKGENQPALSLRS